MKARLTHLTNNNVSVGRPDQANSTGDGTFLNLFLYEISYDQYLKNEPLNEGEKPPIWMVLKYLLTAFETENISDSEAAHNLLGSALRAINRNDIFTLDSLIPTDLKKYKDALFNPDQLYVTLNESPVDLLARLMQGTDEKMRLSICFEVRPVMIAPADPPNYSLLVGVDYTQDPVKIIDSEKAVGLDVIPSMGSFISEIIPESFEIFNPATFDPVTNKQEVRVLGNDLHLSGLSVMVGPLELPVTMQAPDELRFKIDPGAAAASKISAGSHIVTVVKTLEGRGKKRSSNAVIGNLLPRLDKATAGVTGGQNFIDLEGQLLGKDTDDAVLALYLDGKVVKTFDAFVPSAKPASPDQTKRRLIVPDPIAAGSLAILIVNGQRARLSPVVKVTP